MVSAVNVDAFICGRGYVRAVDYRVLGPVEVLADGAPVAAGGPKQRGVVAVLVAAAGRPVSVDTLLQAIYGEDASRAAGRRSTRTSRTFATCSAT